MSEQQSLRICLATSEVTPFAKTGGLADVTSALSAFLHEAGHEVRVLMPRYPRVDEVAEDISPVKGLQDLSIRIGNETFRYSIDVTTLPGGNLPVYLLRCPALYARDGIYTQDRDEHVRFIMLSRAAIEMCQHTGFAPDIFHCHDWHTALIPIYLKTIYAWDKLFAATRSVLTIHNIGYQGIFPASYYHDLGFDGATEYLHQEDLGRGRINFMKTGILYADLITTVSPTYAREIQGEEYGMGLDGLLRQRSGSVIGILNGVDYTEWNPASDPLIPAKFHARRMTGKAKCKLALLAELGLEQDANRPLIGIVSRLVGQKGIELIEEVIPYMLERRDFAMAILGNGEQRYEDFFYWLQKRFPNRVCFYRGFNNRLAHWIEAGSDMFLMPSLYEPCGLNQMYSLKYGTLPIVRETGGLADSVELVNPAAETGTGIVFKDYNAQGLSWAVDQALNLYAKPKLWRKIMKNGMAKDYSWERQGEIYIELFRHLKKTS